MEHRIDELMSEFVEAIRTDEAKLVLPTVYMACLPRVPHAVWPSLSPQDLEASDL
jgi:hypothetical protein